MRSLWRHIASLSQLKERSDPPVSGGESPSSTYDSSFILWIQKNEDLKKRLVANSTPHSPEISKTNSREPSAFLYTTQLTILKKAYPLFSSCFRTVMRARPPSRERTISIKNFQTGATRQRGRRARGCPKASGKRASIESLKPPSAAQGPVRPPVRRTATLPFVVGAIL